MKLFDLNQQTNFELSFESFVPSLHSTGQSKTRSLFIVKRYGLVSECVEVSTVSLARKCKTED